MSTGDQSDFVDRLKSLLPNGWFSGDTPVLDAVLNGIAYCLAFLYGLIAYAKLQTRIKTVSDGFLDLAAFDYFGAFIARRLGELDASLRGRVLQNLLREKATRRGVIKVLTDLTGQVPIVFEPWRPLDCGAYDTNICGYDVAGGYGATDLPYQAFITAYRPLGQGIPFIAGYDCPQGAYDTGSQSEYTDAAMIAGQVTDADIYAAVADAKVEGTLVWMQITNSPQIVLNDKLLLEDGGGFLLEDGSGFLTLEP